MKNYCFLLAFIIALNIGLCTLSYIWGLGRPIFNFDYFILLLTFFISNVFLKNILLFFSFLVIFFIDVLLLALQIFPFVRLIDIIYLSNFIFNGPVLYRSILLLLFFIFVVNFFVVRDFFSKKINIKIQDILIILTLIIAFIFGKYILHPIEENNVYSRFNTTIYGSQLYFFIKNRNSSFVQSFDGERSILEKNRYNYATHSLFNKIERPNGNLSKKILLVVNESWGKTNNEMAHQKIISPITKLEKKLKYFEQGSFNFIGATVAGELRELCNLQPTTFNLRESEPAAFQTCLPNKLKSLGYRTYALHGAMSVMYDRKYWYPMAGFQNINFFEDLPTKGICKSFSGRCDVELIPTVKRKILANEKTFVYWLTLNTHAPYDDKLIYQGFECQNYKIKENSETCSNLKLQYQFFIALSNLVSDKELSGLEVIVVGDHSPPIFNLSDNFFSYRGSDVSWVHFKVK